MLLGQSVTHTRTLAVYMLLLVITTLFINFVEISVVIIYSASYKHNYDA